MSERSYTPGRIEVLPGYEVTLDGKVYSVSHNWRGYGVRELNQTLNGHGYQSVRVTLDGKRKRVLVHKLVAQAFLPPRPSRNHQIRHLDGNKTNNLASNLCWGTAKENAADRKLHNRTSCGEKHGNAIRKGREKKRACANYE